MVKEISINDFDYDLPQERIPIHPLEKRDECKLLVHAPDNHLYHKKFKDLPGLLPLGSLLICNDTKVINARLLFQKETGAFIEIFLLEPLVPADYALNFQSHQNCVWKCLVGNSKKWKEGKIFLTVPIPGKDPIKLYALRLKISDEGSAEIEFSWENPEYSFARIIEFAGKIPIPPYLNRDTEERDLQDYQTVYSKVKGSVAAPTAGLHFTQGVFDDLKAHNVTLNKVTLHVGAGTFRPVKSDRIGEHPMHSEPFTVTRDLISQLILWKQKKKPVVAVGTTTVRTLESLPYIGQALITGKSLFNVVNQWAPYETLEFDTVMALEAILQKMDLDKTDNLWASTSIMIAPGFNWRITDCIITNFHQPKSTLLLLVSSFLGEMKWREVYEEALNHGYRFLSYGDASLLLK